MTEVSESRRGPFLVLVAGIAALLAGFALLTDEVLEGDTLAFDMAVLDATRSAGGAGDPIGPVWLEEAARDITALGSFSVLALVVALVTSDLVLRRQRRIAVFVLSGVIGGSIVSTVLKALFDRPRPDLEAVARVFTASFPSGHAALSAVVYLTLGV